MTPVILDANAVIMHGRAFPNRVRTYVEQGGQIILPESVKQELVDDVLDNDDAPENHQRSAETIKNLIDNEYVTVRSPDFEQYGDVVDEARRRIADESLPEHTVRADQYIPALVCEVAGERPVRLVTADRKLRRIVRDITERRNLADVVTIADPLSVL